MALRTTKYNDNTIFTFMGNEYSVSIRRGPNQRLGVALKASIEVIVHVYPCDGPCWVEDAPNQSLSFLHGYLKVLRHG